MQNRRLIFSFVIKLLIIFGLMLLTVVFVNSLFSSDSRVTKTINGESSSVEIDISDMYKGQIKKIRWNNKEVAVLFRQFPEKLVEQKIENLKEGFHPSIKKRIRSQNEKYFVYFNSGDSKNCPLFYSSGEFKDVCTSNKFDEAGRVLSVPLQGFVLAIPPHHFMANTLVIGQWGP